MKGPKYFAAVVAFLSCSLLVSTTFVAAASSNAPIVGADGTLRYRYGSRQQPTLSCRPLYICDVELEPGESILDLAIGDSVRWIVASAQSGPNGNTPHVFIKPTQLDLDTNLVVTTTKRVYYLRLVSTSDSDGQHIGFYYPEVVVAKTPAQKKTPELTLLPPTQLDYNYTMTGTKFFMPARVYNDGVHTYIEYDSLPMDLPVLYAIAPDGSNQIVNFRLQKNTFIIDGIPGGIDLVLNAGTGKHGRGERRVQLRHK